MSMEQDIMRILQQCKVEIQANMASKGINASKRTSRSFKVEKQPKGMQLVLKHNIGVEVPCKPNGFGSVFAGVAPLETLEIGRPGGKVPKGFYYLIKQWSRDKGLSFSSESDRQRFSYFTARKIAKSGTRRSKSPEKVYSTPVEKARAEVWDIVKEEVYKQMVNKLKGNITA